MTLTARMRRPRCRDIRFTLTVAGSWGPGAKYNRNKSDSKLRNVNKFSSLILRRFLGIMETPGGNYFYVRFFGQEREMEYLRKMTRFLRS